MRQLVVLSLLAACSGIDGGGFFGNTGSDTVGVSVGTNGGKEVPLPKLIDVTFAWSFTAADAGLDAGALTCAQAGVSVVSVTMESTVIAFPCAGTDGPQVGTVAGVMQGTYAYWVTPYDVDGGARAPRVSGDLAPEATTAQVSFAVN